MEVPDVFSYRAFRNRRISVHLTTGRTIRGVLWARRGPLLVLRDAAIIDQHGEHALAGEVLIERERVDFAQVVA